jgi:hypothetical protein
MSSFAILLFACSSSSVEENAEKEEVNTFGKIEVAQLEKVASDVEVIPSPVKMKTELKKAGLNISVGEMIEQKALPSFDIEDKSRVAVLTGILLTDLVITVDKASPERIEKVLVKLKKGFEKLKTGNDIQSTIDDLITTVKTPDFDRSSFLDEVDMLSSVLVPELKSEAGTWAIPLIQAGAWLEGVQVISTSIKKEGAYEKGKKLFHHPGIAPYFIRYIDEAGKEKFSNNLNAQIKTALSKLDAYGKKAEVSKEEIDEVAQIVSDLMGLL